MHELNDLGSRATSYLNNALVRKFFLLLTNILMQEVDRFHSASGLLVHIIRVYHIVGVHCTPSNYFLAVYFML